jgi:hypothetical protein
MARTTVIALRRRGVSQLKRRVPRYDRMPEAAPTAVIAVAMHCAHMRPEYGNSVGSGQATGWRVNVAAHSLCP